MGSDSSANSLYSWVTPSSISLPVHPSLFFVHVTAHDKDASRVLLKWGDQTAGNRRPPTRRRPHATGHMVAATKVVVDGALTRSTEFGARCKCDA